jgi:hypothetical protein
MNAEAPGLRNGVSFPVSVCFNSDWMCATGTRSRKDDYGRVRVDVVEWPRGLSSQSSFISMIFIAPPPSPLANLRAIDA